VGGSGQAGGIVAASRPVVDVGEGQRRDLFVEVVDHLPGGHHPDIEVAGELGQPAGDVDVGGEVGVVGEQDPAFGT
jgi:hypothetical protein